MGAAAMNTTLTALLTTGLIATAPLIPIQLMASEHDTTHNIEHQEQHQGEVHGIVAEMDVRQGALVVVDQMGERHRFVPRWRGGNPKQGGGFDPAMLRKIRSMRPGHVVEVTWSWEEKKRATAISVVQEGPTEGLYTGRIADLVSHKGMLVVENDDGQRRFMPHWRGGAPAQGGGLVRETIERLHDFHEGDLVEVSWEWEERYRVVDIRLLEKGEKHDEKGERKHAEKDHDKWEGGKERDKKGHGKWKGDKEHGEKDHGKWKGDKEHAEKGHDKWKGDKEHAEKDHDKWKGEKEGDGGEKPTVPAGSEGFQGLVRCTAVAKGEDYIDITIEAVRKVWKYNAAPNPKALVGQTVRVYSNWSKVGEHWQRNPLHLTFIAKAPLNRGFELEIKQYEEAFKILELSSKQRSWARK
jgi:hypothetical protein